MPFVFPWENPLVGLFPDEDISFNIDRPPNTLNVTHRTVVILPPSSARGTVIPSVRRKVDAGLLRLLKSIQNWHKVKRFSFEYDSKLFSLYWKFRLDKVELWAKLNFATPLKAKAAKEVKKVTKKHISSLETRLRPGNVFLVPDSELTFGNPERLTKPYSRYVLLYAIRSQQVMIIPFSTQIHMMDPDIDILFDQDYSGPALKPGTRPAVENYPYKMFSRPNVLCVTAIQPFTVQDFLDSALTPVGAVRPRLLRFIAYRLKNLQTNP